MVTLSDLPQELKKLIVEWATEMDKASYSQPPEKEERIGEEIFANGNAPKGTSPFPPPTTSCFTGPPPT